MCLTAAGPRDTLRWMMISRRTLLGAAAVAGGTLVPAAPGRAAVSSLGLEVELGAHVNDRFGCPAGTDEDRLADLRAAFTDPGVRGARGLPEGGPGLRPPGRA